MTYMGARIQRATIARNSAAIASTLRALATPAGSRAHLRRGPAVAREVHPAAVEGHAFGLEQPPLQLRMRLGNADASSGSENAMPGNAASGGTRRERVADGARAAGESQRSGQLSVGRNAPAWNFFHHAVNWFPGHVFESPAGHAMRRF